MIHRLSVQVKLLLILSLAFAVLPAAVSQASDDSIYRLIAPLPDVLLSLDGSRVETAADWEENRREEVLELFRSHVYGRVPDFDYKLSFLVTQEDPAALGGKAVMKEVELRLAIENPEGPGDKELIFAMLLFLPAEAEAAVPLVLGLNFNGNHTTNLSPEITITENWVENKPAYGITGNRATEQSRGARVHRWPVEKILERGYGLATIYYGDIDPDFDDGFENGIHGLVQEKGKGRDAESWGSIATWAWGLSRAMDYFETDPAIDPERVAVIGHSRLGKTALWAGARDERFAMVISNNSGCGGASLSRRPMGESVSRINTVFPHWFAGKFHEYGDNEAACPIDQHMLLSLMAPRPLYVASAQEDAWADPVGEYLSLLASGDVYSLYGEDVLTEKNSPEVNQPAWEGKQGYHIRSGKHDLTAYDWEQYLGFADLHMAGEEMPASPEAEDKPNVLIIVVDDLGWTDLGCYGSTFYDTPRLDHLARQSVRFTNAYAASPVCSPTRAALMTGKHPVRVGITDWIPGMSDESARDPQLLTPEDLHDLPLEELTLAELFRENGYRTFFAGKWHLGESEAFWPRAQGFDINIGGNHKGQPSFPGGKGYYAPYGNPQMEEGPEGEYLTDRLSSESIHFIESASDQPFFLYLSYYTVHTPIQGCEEYDSIYRIKSRALPGKGELSLRNEHQGLTRTNQSNPEYAAMVRSMDSNVGRIMDALESAGKLENTIVLFTSDNGGLSTTRSGGPTSVMPLRAGKGWCYEGGIRVPLMIRLPGMEHAGAISEQPAISMDIFPTVRELANIDTEPGLILDGSSLAPYLRQPLFQDERTLVWHYPHYHGSTWRPGSAIRSGNWKLIEFYEQEKVELFDLSSDLGESHDLSAELPQLADSLQMLMHHHLDQMGANYPKRK